MANIDELIDRLAQDTVAVKAAPHPYLLCLKLTAAAAAYLAVSLAVSGMRPDWVEKFNEPWFVAEIVALVCIFAATSLGAALLSFPDMHQKRRLAFAPVIAVVLFALVMIFAWQADNPPAAMPVHSFECTISITLMALLPAAWTFYAMRKFASTHSRLAGSIALLSAFSAGALWLRLHEVNDSILHLFQWHYLPMIACAAAGWWLGKKILRW